MTSIILLIIILILLVSVITLVAKFYCINRNAIERVLYPNIAQKKRLEQTLEREMQKVKEGKMPSFIGLQLTQEQFDELAPYVKNESYLENTLRARVPSLIEW